MEQQVHYLISHFGYFGIIIALVGGIIGLPIPDETLLTFVGYYVYKGKMKFLFALLSAWIGSSIGISISYVLGVKLGIPFLKKFGLKIHITEKKINRTQVLFRKIGPALLFIGYFIPGVRHVTAYLAGISRYRFSAFCLYAYSGALLWSFTFIKLGLVVGEKWRQVGHYVHHYGFVLVILLLIIACLAVLYFRFKKDRR
ncbi:DedA family protein [Bacillus pseudomycoides]|uniref:DedA family protein n=1 Tax=Bacillus pseudomycoides TaxID=64104 RepID=UPI001FB221C9|nr:DedA family protein [Bacillus pseudomycoides]